nr:uncharacterized protein LOC111419579 [Onthophagus taurus]
MVFTSDQEVARKGVSSLEKRKRDEVPLEDEEESGEDKLEERVTTLDDSSREFEASVPTVSSVQCVTLSDLSAPSTSAACTQKRATRKKRNVSALDKKQENFLDAATTVLTSQNKFRAFGNNVAFQFEDMDRCQRVIAEKLISDVLFYGKLGNLKPYSTVMTEQSNHTNLQSLNYSTQMQPIIQNQYSNQYPHHSYISHTPNYFTQQLCSTPPSQYPPTDTSVVPSPAIANTNFLKAASEPTLYIYSQPRVSN